MGQFGIAADPAESALWKDAPFGEVTEGMDVVGKLYSGYGQGAPSGSGPDQERLEAKGNPCLQAEFPKLDFIKEAGILD